MIVDGKKIAQTICGDLKKQFATKARVLAVILVGDNAASKRYIALKKKFGESVGVEVRVRVFADTVKTDDLQKEMQNLGNDPAINGIIVQLPLPKHLDTEEVLGWIPAHKDVDALSKHATVLSPVVGAIVEILRTHHVSVAGKHVVVLGKGKLVGAPIKAWLKARGAHPSTIDSHTNNPSRYTRLADILISGIGVPRFVTPDMIQKGVVLIDAGTSESSGKLIGDIDPACAKKASLYTPVPGGVGPVTVVMLFKNLLQ